MKIVYLCYSFFVPESSTPQKAPNSDEYRWNLLQKKVQELRAVDAFTLFRENGIEPILIKGLAAAQYYPEARPRISTDVDLAVSVDDFAAATSIVNSKAAEGLAIDIHKELRHLDTLEWTDLFERSQLISVGDTLIRTLCPEDHLRVLCVHWLTDGGSNRDRLSDIYYLVANRPEGFDWKRSLDVVRRQRRRWLVCTLGLAHKYLGLDLKGTPVETEALDLPIWLVKAVEKEWAADDRAWPLEASMDDPRLLMSQIKRRLRPDPIWATVQMNGSFDAKTRVFYQIGNLATRIVPSYRRIIETLRLRLK